MHNSTTRSQNKLFVSPEHHTLITTIGVSRKIII
ncbi:hypothetical protein GGP53_003097 [Salinibacter ruber]|nr:hypothetical protein [Salinibacter ruber]MCS4146126.1 hypothetical protein [Salinibacter ruber]